MPLYRDGRIQAETTVSDWLETLTIPRYFAHRLDRATSGLLLICHSSSAAACMQAQFRNGTIHKQYLAVCRGKSPHHAIIRTSLAQLDGRNASRKRHDQPRQSAWTVARRLVHSQLPETDRNGRKKQYSLALVRTHTGRRHQIRRHFKQINHPLVGDTTWGKGAHNRFFRAQFDSHRLLLHAATLEFSDPATMQIRKLACALDTGFLHTITALGWDATYKRWWSQINS